jgi:DNA invertase Pin-like site-specific DNA recombinase
MLQRCVRYLRSSKDRHDVAIEAQRRALEQLERERGLVCVGEFVDVVESGKDEDRPGLQALLAELYKRDRGWTVITALDTSRIARRAAAAYWFEDRECRPRGVSVVYKNLPEMEEAERAIVKAVFHGVDEWHSLVSKRKGLAGMRENVRAGKRAGGRAPIGYRLEHLPTGAVRDGVSVVKSHLVATEQAPAVRAYLVDRVAGIPRHAAGRRHLAGVAHTTLLSVERNALTYAGHTVWNRLNERGRIGPRERPQSEWEVKRDTHERLITDDQAQLLLEQLARRTRKRSQKAKHDYLLAGLLTTPAGTAWHGVDRDFYRHAKGRRILARRVDRTVVNCLTDDLAGGRLARALLEHMRARLLAPIDAKRLAGLRRSLEAIDTRIRRLADLAAEAETAAPLLRAMAEKELERDRVAGELGALEREAAAQRAMSVITEDQVVDALRAIAVDIAGGKDVPGLRDQIMRLLERVELDPEQPGEVVLRYRLPAIGGGLTGVSMASPRGFERYPGALERRVKLAA